MVKPCGKGRKKIEIKKIADKFAREVTFSKRRSGLFKKANELATLCGVEVGIIVFSPGGRPYSFGHPGIEGVADRFLSNNPDSHDISDFLRGYRENNISKLNEESADLIRQIEVAKAEREVLLDRMRRITGDDGSEMSVDEMKELVKQLKDLKVKADARMAEIIGAGGLVPRCPLPVRPLSMANSSEATSGGGSKSHQHAGGATGYPFTAGREFGAFQLAGGLAGHHFSDPGASASNHPTEGSGTEAPGNTPFFQN